MKIQIWSDYVCPFCYVGKRRLELALENFEHRDKVEVEFKSFELDPNAPLYAGQSIDEMLAAKYGMSLEQAKQANKQVGEQAASVGLTFNFEDMKPTNTFDAHRLAKWALAKGKEQKITESLLYAYFTDAKNIGDPNTLADLAEASGLNREEALQVLTDKTAFANDVRIDEALAKQYQITGVPFFIVNEKYAISGAQPTETFTAALQKIWEEEKPKPRFVDLSPNDASSALCAEGNCTMPTKDS